MAGLQPIAGIRPVAPRPSLLDVASGLPAGTDWSSGVASRGVACAPGHPWPGICPKDAVVTAKKVVAPVIAEPKFIPFQIYVPYACAWVTPDEEGGMQGDAAAQLESVTAWHVSRELWAGTANLMEKSGAGGVVVNPTLMSEATDLTNVNAVDSVFAIAALLSERAACSQAGGAVLHLPTILIPHLTNQGVVKMVNGKLVGPLDTPVSPGPGYPGPGPWGPDGEAAYPGSVWAYVSGPIEVEVGAPKFLPDTDARRWDQRRNRYELWAERAAIVRFDPCCVYAILVDVPNSAPEAS